MSTIIHPESDDSVVAEPDKSAALESSLDTPELSNADQLDPKRANSATPQPRRLFGLSPMQLAALVLGTTILGTAVTLWPSGGDPSRYVLHTVTSGALPITVTERGNLESQQNLKVFCEVDEIRSDGVDGTPILTIVANGTEVRQGDLLVELDSSSHLERLDSQTLSTETAIAAQLQAKIKFENQKSQNQTLREQAELAVDLAKLQLAMFLDQEKGTSVLEAAEISRGIDDTENEIMAAKASLQLVENEMRGTRELYKLGYAGKSELDRTQLDFLQAQSSLTAKINRLETQLGTLSKKTDFERRMSKLQFEGDLKTAERELTQTLRDNEAQLAQAKVALDAANRKLKKEQERLQRYQDQLTKCKIYAQQDGMVAYATPSRYSRSSRIAEGALLRERQHILSLPNLHKMQVKTSVHESVQSRIEAGMACTVRLDAFPDRTHRGSVQSVGVLPDEGSWFSADTKMYTTIVTIDEDVQELKPGMTAVVEIHIDRLEDVLTVPVQAIQQEEESTFCFVLVNGKADRREVKTGATNDKLVVITDGVSSGDRVILNPLAVPRD